MTKNRIFFILASILLTGLFSLEVEMNFYELFSIALQLYVLFDFLDNLGKKIVVLDIAVILAVFTWLIMPIIFYHNYTKNDAVVRAFGKYMPIESGDYFSFVLPGTIATIIGMKIPLGPLLLRTNFGAYRDHLLDYFRGKDKIGYILIGISLSSSVLYYVVPATLSRIVYLLEHLSYVGVFYIFFSDSKHKYKILSAVLSVTLLNSIQTGMFGELVFLLALFYILIALYLRRLSFFLKLGVCLFAICLIFFIQNVKTAYRETYLKREAVGTTGQFADIAVKSVTDPSSMFQKDKLFFTAVRMNQGWLIAVTMDRVPRRFEFANGETILTSVAAAFVPRFIWPDKPEAGGKYNLKRFWGYNLVGYSMNIGPIGEAYANFDRAGGIIFMFFYGLFFNWVLYLLLHWSERKPSIICWIPFLFFYAVVVETDVLTTFSSVVTSLIFMLLFVRLFRMVFHLDI